MTDKSTLRPTDHLKALAAGDWQAATGHAFTDALASNTIPAPVTVEFQALIARAASLGRYEQMLAVYVVAEWVCHGWVSPHQDKAADRPIWFGKWITLHTGEGFASVVTHLRHQLDKVWELLDGQRRTAAGQAFCKTVTLERRYFDAAFAGFPPR